MAAFFLSGRSTRDEPHFQGKALTYWLELYQEDALDAPTPDTDRAEAAIAAIGTNALPHILKWIRYEAPSWRRTVVRYIPGSVYWRFESLQNWSDGGNTEGGRLAGLAVMGFSLLNTNADSAIPELLAMIKQTNAPDTSSRAATALICLGEAAAPALLEAIALPNQTDRYTLIIGFRVIAYLNGTNTAVPYLQQLLTNQNSEIPPLAREVLEEIAPETLPALPPE